MLLSSLEGAAVTSLRVSDVPHEFSDIPGVKEDMTQLLLQTKRLRLIARGRSSRLRLVCAADTVTAAAYLPAEVRIII